MTASHAHAHELGITDPLGRRVGVMVGMIGILLAAVTIASHREHTAALVHRTEANDQWAYYQAKKSREHTSSVAAQLAQAVGTDAPKVASAVEEFKKQSVKYTADAERTMDEAKAAEHETHRAEGRARRFDLGEGFLELGLVLCSPINEIAERWIGKFERGRLRALSDLKKQLERDRQ
jgi:hypothetical protein